LRGLDIVGADVVCLMPTKDQPNQITAMVAAHIMFELTCLIADRLVAAGILAAGSTASPRAVR
jgi:guanidinopropionase